MEGHATTVVAARPGQPPLRLYFDQGNGLLSRLVRYTETPRGSVPPQIDYADYRETDGVRIPYRWTLTRPSGSFSIRVEQAQQSVATDEKLFVARMAVSRRLQQKGVTARPQADALRYPEPEEIAKAA